ncbi:hypothetical protein GUITHDRAFT_114872 [Guillardia theta CCMP2712]|uniref:Uncharacterized protein n=1 Tax=Guillardia theta (strain CCMP2712) TaxID=905079 RepID=L1ISB7_GUITC|nr:hypothetical protein GUITHDRAFT_114872 [Guillardia theta CCMP2712]EKX38992.1 hypothetical protein GUITHDRAFT_114872 [Guillardia theta CCMP2712]|eukprot:XP_005825972.1 hypothetical protein GUITHDRAFT_114872 [Guillardia theta CCMP2712]
MAPKVQDLGVFGDPLNKRDYSLRSRDAYQVLVAAKQRTLYEKSNQQHGRHPDFSGTSSGSNQTAKIYGAAESQMDTGDETPVHCDVVWKPVAQPTKTPIQTPPATQQNKVKPPATQQNKVKPPATQQQEAMIPASKSVQQAAAAREKDNDQNIEFCPPECDPEEDYIYM